MVPLRAAAIHLNVPKTWKAGRELPLTWCEHTHTPFFKYCPVHQRLSSISCFPMGSSRRKHSDTVIYRIYIITHSTSSSPQIYKHPTPTYAEAPPHNLSDYRVLTPNRVHFLSVKPTAIIFSLYSSAEKWRHPGKKIPMQSYFVFWREKRYKNF